MLNLIYYNIKHAKLTPNAKKIAKKCELVNFKFKIVSIKIMKKPQVHYTGTETIKYDTDTPKPVHQVAPNQLDSAYAASRCRLSLTNQPVYQTAPNQLDSAYAASRCRLSPTNQPVYQAAPNQLDSAYATSRCRLSPTKNAITKVPASKLAEPCHHIFCLACSLSKVSL